MDFDIIVLGSGPGGYVTAIRASQLGYKVAVVEREALGGICLNWGCIPTKALLKSAQVFNYIQHAADYGIQVTEAKSDFSAVVQRSRGVAQKMSGGVNFLMKKNKITVLMGEGKLLPGKKLEVSEENGQKKTYSAKHIIVATGARARQLPNLPIDGKHVIGYREAMTLAKQPKSMLVVGSGAIGMEFAYFYNSMGTQVTVVEYLDNILPREDVDVSKEITKVYKKAKMKIKTKAAVQKVTPLANGGCEVEIQHNKTGKVEKVTVDVVLSAVGVSPNTENIGLANLGIKTTKAGHIEVNEVYATNVAGIYAIGDVLETQALAHVASAEGITCVEAIAYKEGKFEHAPQAIDYNNIPACTYCWPEVASVGMTEEQAKASGYELRIGKFPFSASGKASAAGDNAGFVKLIFDKKYGELLGGHMVGANVTEMVAELVAVRKLETTGMELVKTVHPHPTMSEAVMEAAAAAYDEVIHL
ncbi:dihydrolipoyl dehydrogenase [Saprospira grandis]|uniref:Dihydrolipoyl dehydrogenase n=1 Tax=Saprospira grandis (strain Lewin) TaxID=984262 RepID=H6L1D9_SAPGL|nr:dihydrolipoyl dehydrogenase [Saprospira grandis]AFC23480.1 dihydrolipoamide dehydrogenase [Saprospira grandis str. Lewin]